MKSLKAIQSAGTSKALITALTENGIPVPAMLQDAVKAVSNRQSFRTVLAVAVILLVALGTYFSFKGAINIFGSHAVGYASFFFAVMDLAITYVIYRELLSGGLKWGLLFFEIITLLWFGYTINGYFGIGSLQSAANKKITDMYAIVNQTAGNDARSLYQSMQQSQSQAEGIAKDEVRRDGIKGVVFAKANTIAEEKVVAPTDLPTPPKAPMFENLTEANEWLQTQKAKLDESSTVLQSYVTSTKNSAQGSAEGLRASLAGKLNEEQRSNLNMLIHTLDEMGRYEPHTPEISAPVLAQSDMKSEGVGSFIGALVEGVVVILLILLAILSSKKEDIEPFRKESALSAVSYFLGENQIRYDADKLSSLNPQAMALTATLIESTPDFPNYVKNNGSFEEFVSFGQKYPSTLSKLPSAKWRFEEIGAALAADHQAIGYVEKAMMVDKDHIDAISVYVNVPSKVLTIATNPALQTKFQQIVDSFRNKLTNKSETEIQRIISQLMPDDVTPQYLDVLSKMTLKLSAKLLLVLDRGFVSSLSAKTADLILKNMATVPEDTFRKLVQEWDAEENELCNGMLENSISKEPQFGRLFELIIKSVGVRGLRTFYGAYNDSEKVATERPSSVVSIKESAIAELVAAIATQSETNINTAIKNSLEVKSSL